MLQSCPTLWDPRDGSPPGSPLPGILQARALQWVAIAFSNSRILSTTKNDAAESHLVLEEGRGKEKGRRKEGLKEGGTEGRKERGKE